MSVTTCHAKWKQRKAEVIWLLVSHRSWDFCFLGFFFLSIYLFMAVLSLSCGTRAPERMSSLVAAPGLSCPAACGILVPRPGIEPMFPALEGGFLTTGPPEKSLFFIFLDHSIEL